MGKALRQLTPIRQWMALSATPERKTDVSIFGAPVVSVSYAEARDEGVVKDVADSCAGLRVLDQLTGADTVSLTTTGLREDVKAEDIDQWEARKQLRYLSKYCSPILLHGLNKLDELQSQSPMAAHPQMLVYAHSCKHAEVICKMISVLHPGIRVDWVGTGPNGRPPEQNRNIISKFCDAYNDRNDVVKEHELDVLVQVNKASEGFDSKPVCVIVDLSLTGIGPQKIQQYGRGTRAYFGLLLHIFVPTDSHVAPHARLKAKLFDLTTLPDEPVHMNRVRVVISAHIAFATRGHCYRRLKCCMRN